MLQNINFRTTRAIHICIVFTATLAIQELFNFPRGAWTGFAVMMIYVGFDAGSTIHRTFHRFWGATLGLFLSYILWFIGHIDYRTMFFIIPVMVFFAYYSLGKLYMFPTIFTVTLTALGTDYYATNTYYVGWFFSDYFICTVIALLICVFFEYFIFKGRNLTHKFYYELQQEIVKALQDLLVIAATKPINKSKLLKMTIKLNSKVLEFNVFLNNTRHDYNFNDDLLCELDIFFAKTKLVYQNLRQLFILAPPSSDYRWAETTRLIDDLIEISKMVQNDTSINYVGENIVKKN